MNQLRQISIIIFGFLVIHSIIGCGEEEKEGVVVDSFSASELASIPDTLLIDNQSFVIHSSLNRDFMPVAPPDGRPLTVFAKLKTAEEQPFAWVPTDPIFFVVYGSKMWIVAPAIRSQVDPAKQEFYARGGPKWGPGVEVTVVLFFKDGEGIPRRIMERNVLINQSD